MSPGNVSRYDASVFEFGRLQSYAKRVAQETRAQAEPPLTTTVTIRDVVTRTRRAGFLGLRTETYKTTENRSTVQQVVGPHWILFTTSHNIDQENTRRYRAYEFAEKKLWILDEKGQLLKVWKWDDFTLWRDGTTKRENDCTAAPMTEADVLELDREHKFTHHHDHEGHYRGDRTAGRIIRHAKGVGLSLALKSLLER
ncbi:hypothetical protein AB0L82_36320 [Nocardia sp. NPDC052001]|uniref:hypothetical protein n=1 Tax=Nocardia sp. NPDC052001 TaxID=3154853 RepID=UPI00343A8EE7